MPPLIAPEAARWYETHRGITAETLAAFGVEASGLEEVIFTYPGGFRRRRNLLGEGDDRFRWLPPTPKGQIPGLLPPDFVMPASRAFLVEGETDMMALWQNMPEDLRHGIIAVPGVPQFPRHIEELVSEARKVFVIYDNDKAVYNEETGEVDVDKRPASQRGWEKIKERLGHKARRVILPPGIKDVAEFFQEHDWAAFAELLRAAAKPIRHYQGINFYQPVPPTPWLVEDLLVSGEATVLSGYPGTGKSWLTMALALAIAGNDATFLGLPLRQHGKVLYVDQENPLQLVLERLHALGLDEAVHGKPGERLDFLCGAGVRLDLEPEKLLEQALDFEPLAIVLDSQRRVAPNLEENDSRDVAALYQAVTPLARDTGAAVIMLHHTGHADKGRARGSSDIIGAADEAISIVPAVNKKGDATGAVNIFPSKPRRLLAHVSARLEGDMQAGEPVRWVRTDTEEMPF